MTQSKGEALFALQCRVNKLVPEPEFRFHPVRKWRADFGFPDKKILVEIEGGAWVNGRHQRGAGYEADCEKYSTAALMGYRVFRFTTGQVVSGMAINMVKEAVCQ